MFEELLLAEYKELMKCVKQLEEQSINDPNYNAVRKECEEIVTILNQYMEELKPYDRSGTN